MPTTALVLSMDFERICSSNITLQFQGYGWNWRLWLWNRSASTDVVGWALPCATASVVGCGNCHIKCLLSRCSLEPIASSLWSISTFLSLPALPSSLVLMAVWVVFFPCLLLRLQTQQKEEMISRVRVLYYTDLPLSMDGFREERNFNLFFIHKVKDVGGSYFSCIVSLLGEGSRSSPSKWRLKWPMVWRTFACNYSSLFPVRHQRICWCYWRYITSVKGFLEHSRGEEFWRRAVGNDESMCNHQLLSLFNSSVLWEGWRGCFVLQKFEFQRSSTWRDGNCVKNYILHLNPPKAFFVRWSQ